MSLRMRCCAARCGSVKVSSLCTSRSAWTQHSACCPTTNCPASSLSTTASCRKPCAWMLPQSAPSVAIVTGSWITARPASVRVVIPTALSADRYCCPFALGDGSNPLRHLHKLVPGFAAGIDDGLVASPELMTEPVLAHVFPDILDRVQLGRIGRQGQQHDIVGHIEPR